jgi:UDP-N-acetylglucosamine 1-carboxyvinyltransferase
MDMLFKKMDEIGASYKIIKKDSKYSVRVLPHKRLKSASIDTRFYPGFPTDLQSPFAVLMTQAEGESHVFETLFEGRFRYIEELKLMKANIEIVNPYYFIIKGKRELQAAVISSKDIRGGAALLIASTIAKGKTTIEDIDYIDRGYERIDVKLKAIGVSIERID